VTIKSTDRTLPFIKDPNHKRLLLRIIANIASLQQQISSGDIVASSSSSSSSGGSGGGSSAFDLLDTTLGNLIAADGSAFDVLGVGADEQYLSADAAETLGVKWKTPTPGGGLVYAGQISGGGGTATLGEVTGIPSDAVRVLCVVRDVSLTISSGTGRVVVVPGDTSSYSFTSDGDETQIYSAGPTVTDWTSNIGIPIAVTGTGYSGGKFAGIVEFVRQHGTNKWIANSTTGRSDTGGLSTLLSTGYLDFSGPLDRIKTIKYGGTGSVGGGTVDVYYEREALSVSNGAGEFFLGTIAVGSGASSAEMTGIPSSVIALKLVFNNLQSNSNTLLLDLASSASYGESCAGSTTHNTGATTGGYSWTSGSGAEVTYSASLAFKHHGIINLRRMSGTDRWVVSGSVHRETGSSSFLNISLGGEFDLSAVLDRFKIKTSTGTFGANGSIDVYGEYQAVSTGGLTHLGDITGGTTATLGEITGIPSSKSKIILAFDSIAVNVTSGSSKISILCGDSASYATEAEYGAENWDAGSSSEGSTLQSNDGAGFELVGIGTGGNNLLHSGIIEMVRIYGTNTWSVSGALGRESTSSYQYFVSGRITLTNEMDRLKIIAKSGGSPGVYSGGTVSVYCM